MVVPHINGIATATPPHDVHDAFVQFVGDGLADPRQARLFHKMVARAGIARRYSFFEPLSQLGLAPGERFYTPGAFPTTRARMERYEQLAPGLALQAVRRLALGDAPTRAITHLVVASCTGFMAPGLDQRLIQLAGLDPGIERTVVGYMGCYAAVNALRVAHHIVRSDPAARVLVVALELCTLHFQDTAGLDALLSMLLFGDGCAAALVTADPAGLALRDFRAATIGGAAEAITWRIGDHGFTMFLSGEVPGHIRRAMQAEAARSDADGLLRGSRPADYPLWAVHAGGRSILDAVEVGLALPQDALRWSRGVLHDCGNMSSATILFILQRILDAVGTTVPRGAQGVGMAFGPGLAAESFRFTAV